MIEVKISAASIPELADKLLALGRSLEAVTPEVAPADKAKRSRKRAEEVAAVVTEEPAATPLGFDTDVAPVLLRAIEQKGRDAVAAVLTAFGVERASLVPPSQWGELIAALGDV
jgi:hypothetical protein